MPVGVALRSVLAAACKHQEHGARDISGALISAGKASATWLTTTAVIVCANIWHQPMNAQTTTLPTFRESQHLIVVWLLYTKDELHCFSRARMLSDNQVSGGQTIPLGEHHAEAVMRNAALEADAGPVLKGWLPNIVLLHPACHLTTQKLACACCNTRGLHAFPQFMQRSVWA